MQPVQSIALGNEPEQQIANMKKILQRGFKDSIIAICWSCNRVENFTIEETAKHMVEGTWPRCCDEKRMEMDEPGNEPRF